MNKRAARRDHRRRMVARARRVYPDMTHPGKAADHLALCSCWRCGNPRHHAWANPSPLTRQELAFALAAAEQAADA